MYGPPGCSPGPSSAIIPFRAHWWPLRSLPLHTVPALSALPLPSAGFSASQAPSLASSDPLGSAPPSSELLEPWVILLLALISLA